MPLSLSGLTGHSLHLIPILALGVFSLLLIADRFVALYLILPIPGHKKFIAKIHELVSKGRVKEALAHCARNHRKPMAKIIEEGLLRANLGEASVRHGIEIALNDAYQRITARTHYLATLANVSTLMGLCGTVLGLIQSFSSVGGMSAQQRGAVMASGISTAMNSTLCGLGIAIVCMVAYSLYTSRINRLNSQMESAALHTLDSVVNSYLGDNSGEQTEAA